jgi:hypothetical protein
MPLVSVMGATTATPDMNRQSRTECVRRTDVALRHRVFLGL